MSKKRIEHVDGKKHCSKCKIYKPLDCFSKCKGKWDGLRCQCKCCCKEYKKQYQQKNTEKLKEYNKEYYKKNPEQIKDKSKIYREKNQEKIKETNKEYYKKPALFKTFAHRLVIDDKPMKADDGIHLLVACKTCVKHFKPTNLQANNRIQRLAGKGLGESNFYCSDTCKNSCSIYGKQTHRTGENSNLDREMQPTLRKMCLERDNYTCQKCHSTEELHCHHIEGILQNPIESCDLDNTITLCKDCHLFVHRLPGCSYHDMKCLT